MKEIFYALGILATFGLGIWNALNNSQLKRKASFVDTVTNERIKWIERLRHNISDFCGTSHTLSYLDLENTPEDHELYKEVDKLRYLIRLQLNPDGEHDKVIEQLILEIPDLLHQSKKAELKHALTDLVEVTQKLLKQEWDKVKLEANHTKLAR